MTKKEAIKLSGKKKGEICITLIVCSRQKDSDPDV